MCRIRHRQPCRTWSRSCRELERAVDAGEPRRDGRGVHPRSPSGLVGTLRAWLEGVASPRRAVTGVHGSSRTLLVGVDTACTPDTKHAAR
jgi:hypothetical protein